MHAQYGEMFGAVSHSHELNRDVRRATEIIALPVSHGCHHGVIDQCVTYMLHMCIQYVSVYTYNGDQQYVADQLCDGVILGLDFLRQNHCVLDIYPSVGLYRVGRKKRSEL